MADTKKSLAQVTFGSATKNSSLIGVDNGTVKRFPITALVDLMYPVGSYYWSSNPTDPETLFGGTWEAVENRFIYAASTSHPVGETGGEATHTLTVNEIPSHTHNLESITGYDDMNFINDSNTFLLQNSDTTLNYPSAKEARMMYGNTGATGGSAAHNNMPPYITAYCWHRTA